MMAVVLNGSGSGGGLGRVLKTVCTDYGTKKFGFRGMIKARG
jgi:hypothetical protein